MMSQHSNIAAHFDPEDLTPFYRSSAVFVNPMQNGAGVKLKTIEAALRGLPVVSTKTGAEGIGLVKDVHYKCANTPSDFAAQVSDVLRNRKMAHEIVRNAQEFLLDQYDQRKVLGRLLLEASRRIGPQKGALETSTSAR
jgi:glycosyltransferase involved in cell wall biosynthesis